MSVQRFQEHLAALSLYFQISKQPPALASDTVSGAVYLFRHGILEVSHNDFNTYVQPFLRRIEVLQGAGRPFAKDSWRPYRRIEVGLAKHMWAWSLAKVCHRLQIWADTLDNVVARFSRISKSKRVISNRL